MTRGLPRSTAADNHNCDTARIGIPMRAAPKKNDVVQWISP